MESIGSLLLWCSFLIFKESIFCQDDYKQIAVKIITEVFHVGNVSYLDKYPAANTDKYTEDERRGWCNEGFELTRVNREVRKIQFPQTTRTDKLKLYVLVDSASSDSTNTAIEIVTAFKCHTNPPIYIHLHFDDEAEEPQFQVIYKYGETLPSPTEVVMYHIKLVEDIIEANVEEITTSSINSTEISAYDVDELSEEKRLHICERAMRMIPETEFIILNDGRTGKSKYYVVITKSRRRTDKPQSERILLRAFNCPTEPILYIYINEHGYNLFAMVEEDKIILSQPPVFDIMGYEIRRVKSIQIYKSPFESKADEKQFHQVETAKIMETDKKVSRRVQAGTKRTQDSTNDNEKLSEGERLDLCKRAIEAVSGRSVNFTDGVVGLSQFYVIELEDDWWHVEPEVVKSFECPTSPTIFIHIAQRESLEKTVWVIVQSEEDLKMLTSPVQK